MNQIVVDRLNEALQLNQMTATELSRASGLNKSTVSRYLSGKVIPRSIAIERMARVLKVNPAWILGYDVPITDTPEDLPIDVTKLSKRNYERLLAYYQALLDSQEDKK